MLSSSELESLIAMKRSEIYKEKAALGLTAVLTNTPKEEEEEEGQSYALPSPPRDVSCQCLTDQECSESEEKQGQQIKAHDERETDDCIDERLPAGLERYIRRYLGLPVMLKAGEYSPNNPLIRGERNTGDVLLGLGEYERRRNTLRKLQQQQYREYLDQQAKKKQEAKEQAERERREREEKERLREEEREKARLLLEQDRHNDRIASVCYLPEQIQEKFVVVRQNKTKVDTGVQVGNGRPLSVAVQTDDRELYRRLSPSPPRRTPAERELSPRAVPRGLTDRTSTRRSNRDKLASDLRHSYMPSIFDADAIHMRNQQAEKEAAERRQFYQQELKHQIQEQQRIREERRVREKMLEQAELRRVEEQLRVLKEVNEAMKENATEFDKKRTKLQKEIELEQQKYLRAKSQPTHSIVKRNIDTSQSDNNRQIVQETYEKHKQRKPFSTNIPENSVFSENYDVDSYLRKNLNPSRDILNFDIKSSSKSPKFNIDIESIGNKNDSESDCEKQTIVERAIVHDRPKERKLDRPKYEPTFLKNLDLIERSDIDDTPIPVLRHSPQLNESDNKCDGRNKMKVIEDKWQVPAVQKNLLKTLPSEKGKSVNILTQLGSIRRQLQLEQMRLDKAVLSRV